MAGGYYIGRNRLELRSIYGRGERIRTSDSCVPNAVLYQAELHPDCGGLMMRSARDEPEEHQADTRG